MAEISHSDSGSRPSSSRRLRDGPRQYISKTQAFVAYLEGLVVVTPYHRGTADPRASGYAEEVAADVFESTIRQAENGTGRRQNGRQPRGGRRTTTTSHRRRRRVRARQ